MIVAVTGGRKHSLTQLQSVWLVWWLTRNGCTIFRHGAAAGVDSEAASIAADLGILTPPILIEPWPARWKQDGWPQAGHIRNRAMLMGAWPEDDGKGPQARPEALLVFPGGSGTRNCTETAQELGIPRIYAPTCQRT